MGVQGIKGSLGPPGTNGSAGPPGPPGYNGSSPNATGVDLYRNCNTSSRSCTDSSGQAAMGRSCSTMPLPVPVSFITSFCMHLMLPLQIPNLHVSVSTIVIIII